jgi:hypothetical protein
MFDPNPINPPGNTSFDKVAIGYDGKLYALFDNGGFSSPFLVSADPTSGSGFKVSTLSESVNAVAVDASGNIFALRGNSTGEGIDEFSPSLTLLNSLNFPDNTLVTPSNLELSPTGALLATSNKGIILQTTTALSTFTTFSSGISLSPTKTVEEAAAAFVQPPVPEPGTLCLVGAAALGALMRRRTRKVPAP